MRRTLLYIPILLLLAFVLGWYLLAPPQPRAVPPADPGDPRLTYPTPYRNVRPEVQYVGDRACAECHPIETEGFHKHPMGRSLAPVSANALEERYDRAAHNPFVHSGFEFFIDRQGDHVYHHQRRIDAQGRPVTDLAVEASYALGSGTNGRSYLIDRDGRLFQSPISWYTQKGIWDLSPGYKAETAADRPIVTDCLFCHAN